MSRPAELFPYFADVRTLNGVGDKVGQALGRAMGERVRDLILTPPASLIDRSYRPMISGAQQGDIATFEITVGSHMEPRQKGRPYRIRVFDNTGDMTLVFFKPRKAYLQAQLPEGSTRVISGKCEVYNAELQMTHPDYIVAPDNVEALPKFGISDVMSRVLLLVLSLDTLADLKGDGGLWSHLGFLTFWIR